MCEEGRVHGIALEEEELWPGVWTPMSPIEEYRNPGYTFKGGKPIKHEEEFEEMYRRIPPRPRRIRKPRYRLRRKSRYNPYW
jgi:hypothetical protein